MTAAAPAPAPSAAEPLSDVVGHAETKAVLLALLDRDRLPNGVLLTGAEGRGKRTLALSFAGEALRRAAPPGGGPSAMKRARDGAHPELVVVEPLPDERFLPVRRVRKLLERCSLSVADGGLRVVVLPRLQRINEESGNALLKFLEEPPPGTTVVATAADPAQVLETIRSRLRRLPVYGLPTADVEAVAVRHGADRQAAHLAAPLCEGAPGAVFRFLRGDAEAALLAPLRRLYDPQVSAYAWAEETAKAAKDHGADWTESEATLGPPAAVRAMAELRAGEDDDAGPKAGTQEASRMWLRPLLTAVAFVEQDCGRAFHGAPRRADGLARAVGAPPGRPSRVAAAFEAQERLDRNLGAPLLLEALARVIKSAR